MKHAMMNSLQLTFSRMKFCFIFAPGAKLHRIQHKFQGSMENRARLQSYGIFRDTRTNAFADANGLNQRKRVTELQDNGTIVSIE